MEFPRVCLEHLVQFKENGVDRELKLVFVFGAADCPDNDEKGWLFVLSAEQSLRSRFTEVALREGCAEEHISVRHGCIKRDR